MKAKSPIYTYTQWIHHMYLTDSEIATCRYFHLNIRMGNISFWGQGAALKLYFHGGSNQLCAISHFTRVLDYFLMQAEGCFDSVVLNLWISPTTKCGLSFES